MTPDEAERAVRDRATVRLLTAHDGSEHARGRVVSYSLVPTVTIELGENGSHISWRHDLAEVVPPPKPDEPLGLGAVVEDVDGADWHRTAEGRWISGEGLCSRGSGWDGIIAVRVLSEGVRP